MRFALIGPVYPYRGGIAHYTTSLANALIEAGHEVKVFSFSRQYPRWLYPGKSDKDPSKVYQQVEALYTIDTLNPISWIRTARLISQYRPDLVIFQWWTTFMAPAFWIMAKTLRAKDFSLTFLIHNLLPHEKKIYDPYITKFTLQTSDAILVQSQREMDKVYRLLPKKKVYLHDMPILQLENTRIEKNEARLYLGIPISIPTILFFGIVRPYKGLRDLLISLAKLREEGFRFHLLIIGEFWESSLEYTELIKALEMEKYVHIEDRYVPNEDLIYYFSASDFLVAPYREGTQSAAVKLAIGFGLPVIISDVIEDNLISSLENVIKFKTGNIASLSEAIRKMLRDFKNYSLPNTNELMIAKSWNSLSYTIQKISNELRNDTKLDTSSFQ
ncbi:MAG: glycosyltransferase [Thermosphaera sp.]